MRVLYKHCCGLDIHKQFVVACLLRTSAEGSVDKEIRTFSTMTNELLTRCDWLAAEQCTHVVMESTAAFWRPIYNLLEGQVELLVVNAAHIKAVPGRKTDVKDGCQGRMSRTPSGWPSGWPSGCATGWCVGASSPPPRNDSCATSRATAFISSTSAPDSPTACKSCSRMPTSSLRPS